jgi:integrase
MKGHVKQRAPGSWSLVLELGTDQETGKRKQKWVTVRGTKRHAETELTRLLNELNTGTFVEPSRLTVPEYLDRWLIDYAEPNVSPKTIERYRSIITHHLKPAFGNLPLTKLAPLHIQAHSTKAMKDGGRKDGREGGLSAQTVLHHHRVLHEALAMGVKWQLLARNPADAVEPPKVRKKKVKPIDETESVWLMEAALGTRLYVPIMLSICAGLRRGEILPLKWTDYEPALCRLWIRRALIETKEQGVLIKETKSERVRSITLPKDGDGGSRDPPSRAGQA